MRGLPGLMFAVLSVAPAGLAAQESPPLQARLLGDPSPGRDAPPFALPYATAEGIGPADQPFMLRAELGHVVVLAFIAGTSDSAAAKLLRTLAAREAFTTAGNIVVAGLLAGDAEGLSLFARETGIPFKLLSDRGDGIRRRFGVGRGETGVYVIDPSGRVAWRDTRFNPFLEAGYDRLAREVVAAAHR
jgi:peroxiredoxin